jgi:uncharacterized protein (UPF0335 family)
MNTGCKKVRAVESVVARMRMEILKKTIEDLNQDCKQLGRDLNSVFTKLIQLGFKVSF